MKQAKIEWKQGQPVSQRFDDIYFSREDGVAESEYVFLKNNDLPDRWLNSQQFVIAETGFGTGLNFLITLRHWLATAPENARLHYYSIEKYPLTVSDLEKALSVWPEYQTLLDELLAVYPPAVKGCHPLYLCDRRVTLVLMFGDITEMLRELPTSVDVWYLDGFAPAKNPEMWTADIFKGIAQHSHRGSHFSTFTAVGDVRRGLTDAGFEVRRVRGFASKREMLVGSLQTERPVRQAMPWFKLPVSNISSKKVAVIGAGIAGITTAWALANRGWQVSLLEQCSDIAQQASGNPLGVLMPRITLDQSVEGEFYASAFFLMLSLLKQLKQSDTGFSWQSKGVLQLASSERIRKQINTLDLPVEYVRKVSAQTASELCGLDVTAEALFFEQAGWFRPADFCQRLLGLQSSHIQLHTRTRVDGLRFESDSWQLDCGEQQTLQVDAVVLANAAKVADFQQTDFLQLQQSRGQISYMPANELSQRIQCAVCYDGYVIPEQSGIHVLGATFDTTEQSQSVLVDDHVKNIHAANQWLGQLFTETDAEAVDGRVGFRAGTTDRLPLVGPVPALNYYQTHYNDLYKGKRADLYPDARYSPGLYVNVGHGARGLTSSLLSAEIIAAQLNNEPAPVSNKLLNALHPGRFLIRKYKKGKTD